MRHRNLGDESFLFDSDHGLGDVTPVHLLDYPSRLTSQREAATPLPRHRILIVDDAPAAGFMLQALLEKLGQDASCTACPLDAIETAHLERPDVVISDIGMPGVDGYELARRLRRNPALQDVTLVALTGYGDDSDKVESVRAGFDHHLVKPVGVEDLRQLLKGLPPLT